MEGIETLYKMNGFQTVLTEEVKKKLPREVWLELIDFLSSVEFIKRLVAPENVRGYAKDRPRETKFYNDGRVNVDLTNPHILEDMDFFRERAIFFEKHGKLDNLNKFVSLNAQKIYNLNPVKKTVKLIKKDFIVPSAYEYKDESVVPMYWGEKLAWSIKSIS